MLQSAPDEVRTPTSEILCIIGAIHLVLVTPLLQTLWHTRLEELASLGMVLALGTLLHQSHIVITHPIAFIHHLCP